MIVSCRANRMWGAVVAMLVLPCLAAAEIDDLHTFTPSPPLGPVITARPGSSEVLDLEACLAAAHADNDSLTAERQRRFELAGLRNQALATGLPSFDLVSDWTRRRDPSFALDPTFGGGGGFTAPIGADPWFTDWLQGFGSIIPAAEDIQPATYWSTRMTMNWDLNPRKVLGAVGAANLSLDRQELLIDAAENATAATVIDAYHAVIMAAEAVNAVEARYANQQELLSLTSLRYELGLATRLDTLQAAVALANLEPDLRRYRHQVASAGARLNAMMGRDPAGPLAIANEGGVESDPLNRQAAIDMAIDRPDLQAADKLIGMLDRQRQTQGAERWWPYLSIYGAYGWVGTEFDSQFDTGHESWTVSAALNLPLWNGQRTSGELQESKAKIRRSEVELRGYRRQAQVAVIVVLDGLDAARQNLGAAALNLERAEEALDESLLMYQLGKARYLDVLDAESGHLTARLTLIEARYQVLTLTASLKQALGASPAEPLNNIPGLVAATRP